MKIYVVGRSWVIDHGIVEEGENKGRPKFEFLTSSGMTIGRYPTLDEKIAVEEIEKQERDRAGLSRFRLAGTNVHEIKFSWLVRAVLRAIFL